MKIFICFIVMSILTITISQNGKTAELEKSNFDFIISDLFSVIVDSAQNKIGLFSQLTIEKKILFENNLLKTMQICNQSFLFLKKERLKKEYLKTDKYWWDGKEYTISVDKNKNYKPDDIPINFSIDTNSIYWKGEHKKIPYMVRSDTVWSYYDSFISFVNDHDILKYNIKNNNNILTYTLDKFESDILIDTAFYLMNSSSSVKNNYLNHEYIQLNQDILNPSIINIVDSYLIQQNSISPVMEEIDDIEISPLFFFSDVRIKGNTLYTSAKCYLNIQDHSILDSDVHRGLDDENLDYYPIVVALNLDLTIRGKEILSTNGNMSGSLFAEFKIPYKSLASKKINKGSKAYLSVDYSIKNKEVYFNNVVITLIINDEKYRSQDLHKEFTGYPIIQIIDSPLIIQSTIPTDW